MYIKKRSQLKLSETISILVVFFILIFVAFVIYTNQKSDSIDEKIEEQNVMRSVEVATLAYMLPEVVCSESQCIGCSGALDMLKLDAVSNYTGATEKIIYEEEQYFQLFGYATIKVDIIYPQSDDLSSLVTHNWTLYNKTAPGIRNVIQPTYIPINVFNPFDNQCYFGVMQVATYS